MSIGLIKVQHALDCPARRLRAQIKTGAVHYQVKSSNLPCARVERAWRRRDEAGDSRNDGSIVIGSKWGFPSRFDIVDIAIFSPSKADDHDARFLFGAPIGDANDPRAMWIVERRRRREGDDVLSVACRRQPRRVDCGGHGPGRTCFVGGLCRDGEGQGQRSQAGNREPHAPISTYPGIASTRASQRCTAG